MQLSNTEALSAYVFGSKSRLGSLPVARSFDSEVIGETAGRMQSIVSEHQAWLSSNCDRQVSNYRWAICPAPCIPVPINGCQINPITERTGHQ